MGNSTCFNDGRMDGWMDGWMMMIIIYDDGKGIDVIAIIIIIIIIIVAYYY